MEEKKVKKISLTTIVLIFALIVIVFMGLLIYRIGNEKNSEEEKVKKLEAQVNNLADEKLSRSNSRLENEIEDSEEDVEEKEEKENDKADSSSATKDSGTFKTNYSSSTESKNESENFSFKYGTFKSGDVVIAFGNILNYHLYLDGYFINGKYEVSGNKVLCKIDTYSYYSSEGINFNAVPKGEDWTFTFDIKGENSLKVSDIQLPDSEKEIIIGIYNLMDNKEFSRAKDSDYTISGVYYPKYAQGDEPCYVFSSGNKVSYSTLWECTGTYTIKDAKITITFTDAVDADGKKAEPKDFNVPDMETFTIIDNNTILSNTNGIIYVK